MLNEEIIVKIIDVDNKGNGIARVNNMVIFVKGALKDETVNIKITSIKKHYMTGSIIKIKTTSKDRIKVKCPYFNKCGGCKFLHTTLSNEQKIKENFIKNLFKKYKVKIIDIDYEYNYRNKVTLHIKNGKLGFYTEKTNDLIEIDNCLLLDNNINKVISKLKDYNLLNIKEIVIKSTYFTKELMIIIKGNLNDKDLKDIQKINNLKSLYLNNKLIYGALYLTEEINGIKYTIYPDAFFQVNTKGMILLYEEIKRYAGKANTLLDLYSGTGTIGIYLKDNFKKITGIEINKKSINNANINKKLNKIDNINFICADSSSKSDNYDCLVVDPPRVGLSKKVISNIIKGDYKKVIYVSCNPLTLKRDLDYLKEQYEVKEISMLNMFVKTEHMECICLLENKS